MLAISFILPPATCDLGLSNSDKGLLNSSVFLGVFFRLNYNMAKKRKKITALIISSTKFYQTIINLELNIIIFSLYFNFFIGMMIGGYIWGTLADIYGRRYVLLWSLTVNGIGGLSSSLSQSFPVFILLRFISGIGYVLYFDSKFSSP